MKQNCNLIEKTKKILDNNKKIEEILDSDSVKVTCDFSSNSDDSSMPERESEDKSTSDSDEVVQCKKTKDDEWL